MLIGWARADITPDRPTALRGQFRTRISEYVGDPLTVTALALEGQNGAGDAEQTVMVSCDRGTIPGFIHERICEVLRSRLPELDTGKLFLNATHTHAAPTLTEGIYPPDDPPVMSPTEYAEVFVERVADAVIDAWQRRAPGGVSWGLGHAVVGHNRRASYADGRSQMYGDTSLPDFWGMEGYEDHSLDLLFTWDAADALTGVIVNLACPSQVTENVSYVTADYWHEVRVDLARRLGDSVFVMSQCSAAGDQSPHLLVDKAAEKRMLELRGLTEREEIARRVGLSVEDVVELAACDIRRDPVLEHSLRKVNLPIRRVTDEEYETSRTTIEELEAENPDPKDSLASSRHFIMLRRNRTVVARYESQDAEPWREVELHCVRLGDIAFATSPFEYFLDYGLRIAARSRAVQTFVVQLASGGPDNDGTYLPTERAVAARSYGAEAVDSSVGPDGGQVIVEETLEALDAMWDD